MTNALVTKIANIAGKAQTGEPDRLSGAFSGAFSKQELAALSRLGTSLAVEPGANLVHQGRTGQQAFVVQQGTAQVVRDGQIIAEIEPGAVFGEGALLEGARRNASVVAPTPMQVYVLTPAEFASVLTVCPRLDTEIRQLAADRAA